MRWSIIRLIWLRELRDQLRDRRTLFMIAVLPLLLYPVLGFAVLRFALGLAERKTVVGIVAPDGERDFPVQLKRERPGERPEYPLLLHDGKPTDAASKAIAQILKKLEFRFFSAAAGQEKLEDKSIDFLLSAEPDFFTRLDRSEGDAEQQARITIQSRLGQDRLNQAMARLDPLLDFWKKELNKIRLERHRLPANFDEPFKEVDSFPEVEGQSSVPLLNLMIRVFPFMLVMWSLAGAFYPAVDLCAGEKERGTMETLLISPAGREEIVLGKFLTIWIFSGGTALLNLLSMGLTTWYFSERIAQQYPQATLPIMSLFACLTLLIPMSAFFSALTLAVGAYARSSKEGQYYLMPLFLIVMPLMFLTLAPGAELSPFYSLVPVTGAALLMQKLMTAKSLTQVPWLYFIPVLAPLVLYSYLAMRWAVAQFRREEVLFREAERLDVRLWLKRLLREKEATPTTSQAAFVFALMLALHWISLTIGRGVPIAVHTGVRLLAFVAAPALLTTLLLNTRPIEGLRLKWPRGREIGLAAILAVLLLPPLTFVWAELFTHYPQLTKLLEDRQPLLQELHALIDGQPASFSLPLNLLVFALLPAVCEELAFRGFLLTGLQKSFRTRTAVLLCSFLFALYHMNVFRFLPAFFLGVVLGLLTVRSKSLVPAMMFSFLHNATLILGLRLFAELGEKIPQELKNLWLPFNVVFVLVAVILLWRLYLAPYKLEASLTYSQSPSASEVSSQKPR